MTNSYPSGSPGVPESSMPTGAPGLMPRRTSYASVVSGTAASFTQSYQHPSRSGAFSHLLNQSSDHSYDASYHHGGGSSRYDSRGNDMDMQRIGGIYGGSSSWGRSGQLPSFSSAFGSLTNGYGLDGGSGAPVEQFFTPSYLRGSKHVQRLEETYRAKLIARRDAPSAHSSQPGSLSTSNSSANLNAKLAPSHRGMTYDLIEKAPPLEDDGLAPLPSKWNTHDKHASLEVLGDGQEVKFTGTRSSSDRDLDASSIRSDQPIPPQCGIYYFEVTILTRKREESSIGIGFSAKDVSLNRPPGWEPESWAYHGDDGHSYCSHSSGKTYGPPFTAPDVIGCGINFRTGHAFFTKNGDWLGVAFREIKGKLFPSVGMKKSGEHIRVNFGQSPFVFDIDGMMSVSQPSPFGSVHNIIPSFFNDPDRRPLLPLQKSAFRYVSICSPLSDLVVIDHMLSVGSHPGPINLIMQLYTRGHGTSTILPGSERRLFESLRRWRSRSIYCMRMFDSNFGQQMPGPGQDQVTVPYELVWFLPPASFSGPERSSSEALLDGIARENLTYLRWAANPASPASPFPPEGQLMLLNEDRVMRPRIMAMMAETSYVSPIVIERSQRALEEEAIADENRIKIEKQRVNQQVESASTLKLAPGLDEDSLVQALVLQFLSHNGHVETAKAFAEEVHSERQALSLNTKSPLNPFDFAKEDEDAVNRQRIRTAILDGDVDKALKHTSAYYPNVLKDNEHIYFRLRNQKFIEMVRQSSEIRSNSMNGSKKSNGHGGDWYEDVINHDMELDDPPITSNGHEKMDTESNEREADYNELMQQTVDYGKVLSAEFQHDPRREVQQAMKDAFALLAYEDPMNAKTLSHLLKREARVSVAEELNSAILVSLGKSSCAALERVIQQTTVLIEDLRENGGAGAFINIDDYLKPRPEL